MSPRKELVDAVLSVLMMGGKKAADAVRRSAVTRGVLNEIEAFPSVVSREASPGLLGVRQAAPAAAPSRLPESVRGLVGDTSSARRPASRPSGSPAPRPEFGPEARRPAPTPPAGSTPVNTLIPGQMQGPRQRGGALVSTSEPELPTPQQRTAFTPDLFPPERALVPADQLELPLAQTRFPAGTRALAEYTTAKGAIRPVGTSLGGQPYRQGPFNTAYNQETVGLSFGRPGAPIQGPGRAPMQGPATAPEEMVQGSFFRSEPAAYFDGDYILRPDLVQTQIPRAGIRMGATQGPSEYVAPRAAFGPGAGPAPADVAFDRATSEAIRNAAGGVQVGDLSKLSEKIDPNLLRMLVGGGSAAVGLGIGAYGLSRMGLGPSPEGSAPIGPQESTAGSPPGMPPVLIGEAPGVPFGEAEFGVEDLPTPGTTIDPSAPAPVVTPGADRASVVREQLAQYAPRAAAVMRASEPMSPEKYRSVEDYYAARAAYASQKPQVQALMKYASGTTEDPQLAVALGKWAQANPTLAYELQRQQLRNPAASQQSPESVTTTTVDAAIGSQNDATAVGSAIATGQTATQPTQGSSDLMDVTRPLEKPYLQRTQDFISRMAPRASMYAGYGR